MPNFKAKINYDAICAYFQNNNDDKQTKFSFITKEQNDVSLVHASLQGKSFFLQLKKQGDYHLVKLDKHSRIDDLALSSYALNDFCNAFCYDVIHSTIGFNKPKLSSNVIDTNELLNKIQNYKKVIIEIGFGSARQMLYQAKTNSSDVLIVGIEIYKPSILQASKLLSGYENVVLLNEDARFLCDILPKHSIDRLLLHFPVPWNDSKTRRVISSEFFYNLSYILKIGGEFWLRTDDFEYFSDAKSLLKDFDISVKINEEDNITSKYEARWLKMQKNIYDIYALNTKDVFKDEIDFSLNKIKAKKLDRQKIIGDDYFLSIERDYEILYPLSYQNKSMLKISYGSFTKPFHAYILEDEFLFKKPFLCHQNIKALKKLQDLLGESVASTNSSS